MPEPRLPSPGPGRQRDEILATGPDLTVLPDEPCAFTAGDGPEYFPALTPRWQHLAAAA